MRIHRLQRLAVLAVLSLRLTASAALELPPEVAVAFRRAGIDDDGYLYSSGNRQEWVIEYVGSHWEVVPPGNARRELIVDYVKSHWRELLDNLEEVPSSNGKVRPAARVVGAAATELPPMEYLDFLDHFLAVYSRGGIQDDILRSQLGGYYRKSNFVTMNYSHPRIQALLRRAKELVPKENAEFQQSLDEKLSGKRAGWLFVDDGNFYINIFDEFRPAPEMLPGVTLRRWVRRLFPFALVILALVGWRRALKWRSARKKRRHSRDSRAWL